MAIVTISRQMGTGAYAMAKELSKKLKYTLIDGPKIAELAKSYGLAEDILERIDEKPPAYITAEDRLQAANLSTMELVLMDAARKGNVVLYGRGAQYLLDGMTNVLRVRIIAPFEERVENLAEREWIDPDLARDLIRRSDHQRGGFTHFYFDRDWQSPFEYDLVFNTSKLSKSAIVEAIVAAAKDPKLKEGEAELASHLGDLILRKRVEVALLKSGKIDSLHFKIECMDGEISLTGHVHDDEEREEAVRIAEKVKGVKGVDDDLQVMNYQHHRE
ncbi:cytidylate kinase family protein [Geotalea sp. SG265]|uniref:cytidylate kinase family protein n=1 Tax=Geotalea sp. SG265 TaxID=2922867 RepID=UPI001FB0494D|nr:cytidylate kinase family protein [Geotalea sp. SG265]